MAMTLSRRFIKAEDLVTRRVAAETIIVPIKAHVAELDSIYCLNDIGSFIWEQMDRHTQISAIVDAICTEYDVTQEDLMNDIAAFLGSLEAAGLIRAATDGET